MKSLVKYVVLVLAVLTAGIIVFSFLQKHGAFMNNEEKISLVNERLGLTMPSSAKMVRFVILEKQVFNKDLYGFEGKTIKYFTAKIRIEASDVGDFTDILISKFGNGYQPDERYDRAIDLHKLIKEFSSQETVYCSYQYTTLTYHGWMQMLNVLISINKDSDNYYFYVLYGCP